MGNRRLWNARVVANFTGGEPKIGYSKDNRNSIIGMLSSRSFIWSRHYIGAGNIADFVSLRRVGGWPAEPRLVKSANQHLCTTVQEARSGDLSRGPDGALTVRDGAVT